MSDINFPYESNEGKKSETNLQINTKIAAAELESFYNKLGGERRLPKLERIPTQTDLIQIRLIDGNDWTLIEFKPTSETSCILYINTNETDTWAWRMGESSLGVNTYLAGSNSLKSIAFCANFIAHMQESLDQTFIIQDNPLRSIEFDNNEQNGVSLRSTNNNSHQSSKVVIKRGRLKSKRDEIQDRRIEVPRLRNEGRTIAQIAEYFDVSEATIKRDLASLKRPQK